MNIAEEKKKIQFALKQVVDVEHGDSAIIIIGNNNGSAAVHVGEHDQIAISMATVMAQDNEYAAIIKRAVLLYEYYNRKLN